MMKRLLVYDLNKTLYKKSSKNEFFKFLIKKRPSAGLYIFKMLYAGMLYSLGLKDKTWFKQKFYSYLNGFKPSELKELSREYWDREFPNNFRGDILQELRKGTRKGMEVYVITGAYDIYTKYLEDLLPVNLIATRTHYKNGRYIIEGKACNDEEKVRRLREEVKTEFIVHRAYSDDDEEILYLAEEGYYLNNEKLQLVQKKNRR